MKIRRGVTVIGLGNWGTSLAAALNAEGLLAGRVHPRRPAKAAFAELNARILWLTVPDDAIGATAEWLVHRSADLRGQVVVHSSGALDAGVLKAARTAGALTASMHPMMSFPTRRVVPVAGVRFAVECEDTALRKQLFALVRRIDGKPFAIASEHKALYHAGAMFGSPLLTAVLAAGVKVLGEAGIAEKDALDLLGPMAAATVENIRKRGPADSFSGPFARGDAATIKLHRKALAGHLLEAAVYDVLARFAEQEMPSADRSSIRQALAVPRRRTRI